MSLEDLEEVEGPEHEAYGVPRCGHVGALLRTGHVVEAHCDPGHQILRGGGGGETKGSVDRAGLSTGHLRFLQLVLCAGVPTHFLRCLQSHLKKHTHLPRPLNLCTTQ